MRRQREREETKLEPSEWTERPNDHGPAILGAYATAHACRAHPTHTSDIPLLTLEPCRRCWVSMSNRVHFLTFWSSLLFSSILCLTQHRIYRLQIQHRLSDSDFQCNLGLSDSKRSCAPPVKLGSVVGGGGGPHGTGSHSLADGARASGPAAVGCYVWAPKPGNGGGAVFVAT